MATMIPKGLGAAVLASLPAQQGVQGGETIQSIVFSIILCSTMLTTLLTFLVDKTWLSNIYEWIFRLTGLRADPADEVPTAREEAEKAFADQFSSEFESVKKANAETKADKE